MGYAKAFAKTCQFLSSDGCCELKSKSKNETLFLKEKSLYFNLIYKKGAEGQAILSFVLLW